MNYLQMLDSVTYDTSALTPEDDIPNHTWVFNPRPDVHAVWEQLILIIRKTMRLRRYELVTLITAQALHCDYCVLAHSQILQDNIFSQGELSAILDDYRTAGLSLDEVTILDFARKITLEAHTITQSDLNNLHQQGLSIDEIFDIILVVAARCFFSTILNATGVIPDAKYDALAKMLHLTQI